MNTPNTNIPEEKKRVVQPAIEAVDAPTPQAEYAPTPQTSSMPGMTQTAQTDPYAGYQKQMNDSYATTLADIRKRRQELEQKYQPDIERQQKVMKIMALGKLIGAMGQFVGNAAGGGAGTIAPDKDPYMINSWNRLNQTKNEQRYYANMLDAEERAARQGMQQGLSKLNIERAKAMARQEELSRKYSLDMQKLAANTQIKVMLAEADRQFKREMLDAKNEAQMKLAEQRHQYALDEIAKRAGVQSSLIGERNKAAKNLWDYKGQHPHYSNPIDARIATLMGGGGWGGYGYSAPDDTDDIAGFDDEEE